MIKIIFAMYNPETDCVEVSLDDKIHATFDCQKYNAPIHLNEPSDIAYLTRLAREEPGLYAKLAAKDGGLQGYVLHPYISLVKFSKYFFPNIYIVLLNISFP